MRRTLRWLPLAVIMATPLQASAQEIGPISRALPNDVRAVPDIAYATYGDRTLHLDLYEPRDRGTGTGRLPAIVVIRGGGWRVGDKEAFGPMAAALAQRGLVAVSIEYRASGEATFPAAVHDTKAAVRWLRANASEYGVDPGAIGAIGGSAGAHLATYLGVTSDQDELEGGGGNPDQSSTVSAVVGLAAPVEFEGDSEAVSAFLGATHDSDPELWKFASPASHVTEDAPPVLLVHSASDPVVPFEQSLRLAELYGRVNAPVEVYLIPDAPHGFWNRREWFSDTMDRSAEFFWRHLGRPAQHGELWEVPFRLHERRPVRGTADQTIHCPG